MGGAIISESGGGIIPLRGAPSSWNWGAASSGISNRPTGEPEGQQSCLSPFCVGLAQTPGPMGKAAVAEGLQLLLAAFSAFFSLVRTGSSCRSRGLIARIRHH